LIFTLAAPAAAAADPTVTPAQSCVRYVKGIPTVRLSAAGWAPGSALTFKIAGRTIGTGTADASGAFSNATGNAFQPPRFGRNLRTATLTAQDAAGHVASSPISVVKVVVDVPSRARPSQRVKYRAFGFLPGKRLYLFVRRGGKTKGRFVLGKPKGKCGTLTKRMRYMPLRKWSTGRYEYWFSHSPRYSVQTRIYGYAVTIDRR
jgi:hypothetical protein